MTGAVDALAGLAVVITTIVLPLTRQTVGLREEQRVNKQKKRDIIWKK